MGVGKCLEYTALVIVACMLLTEKAYAKGIGSSELIDKAREYDGKQVIYSGEAIGDIMRRGDNAWINVSDGDNAIGIWMPYSEVKKIKYTGSYGYRGDIIRVKGSFNRACAEHGGDFDIHSDFIEVISRGSKVVRAVSRSRIYISAALSVLAIALMILMLKRRA